MGESIISELDNIILFDQFYVSFEPTKNRQVGVSASANFDTTCYCILLNDAILLYRAPHVFGIIRFRASTPFWARQSHVEAGHLTLRLITIEWVAIDGIQYNIKLAPCDRLDKISETCYKWIRAINVHRFTESTLDWPIILEDKVLLVHQA